MTKKDASKEKILTQAQSARFNTIFSNYIERFRRNPSVAPANASQANPGSAMAANDATNGLTTNDGNLPSKTTWFPKLRFVRSLTASIFIGKEERTPSDSQMNVNERPMMEVKKQKTQK